ncbi:MAG: DNA-3-methyladenine glycosylase [Fidelibacterota bacterium]
MNTILPRSFFQNDVREVARRLPGKIFVRTYPDGERISGRIVETEAYAGFGDPASHSCRGKTPRNTVMFGPAGYLYVYFTYGMHFCCNIVTGEENCGEAVLLRAMEPLEGTDMMIRNRYGRDTVSAGEYANLSNGPAKLCSAMDITRAQNGADLLSDDLHIENDQEIPDPPVLSSGRIGIRRGTSLQWRFYLKDNPWVSKKRNSS